MRAWLFQDTKQKQRLGTKCPWAVGWYTPEGKKRSKKVGAKSMAEKYRRKIQSELALGLCEDRKRTKWKDFRQQYEEDVVSLKAVETQKIYGRTFDKFEELMAPVYVDAISTETVDAFVRKRKNSSGAIAPATVNKDLRLLRAAFNKAKKWRKISEVPDFAMLREPERDPYFIDDETFKALYDACDSMVRPRERNYPAKDWWQGLLCFGYMTGWRIGEILDLRRDDVDLDEGIASIDAESTKGKREARIELHPVVVDHIRALTDFTPFVFDWPHHERTLWADFKKLKQAAGVDFPGAFHRLRFGFANANVDSLDADLLQQLMRHRDAQTTRKYINSVQRLRRAKTADCLQVPDVLKVSVG